MKYNFVRTPSKGIVVHLPNVCVVNVFWTDCKDSRILEKEKGEDSASHSNSVHVTWFKWKRRRRRIPCELLKGGRYNPFWNPMVIGDPKTNDDRETSWYCFWRWFRKKSQMQNTCQRKERDAKDEMTLILRWSSARLASYYSVQAGDVLMQDEVEELPRKRRELANKCKRNPHGHSAAARTAVSDKKVMSQVIFDQAVTAVPLLGAILLLPATETT